jgi:endoglucanase
VQDGEVILKLHFWSGEVIDYKLKIEGNKVVGTFNGKEPETEETVFAGPDDVSETTEREASTAGTIGSRPYLYYVIGLTTLLVPLGLAALMYRKGRFR